MQTTGRLGASPGMIIFTGEGTTMSTEIDYRMERLAGEAARERLAGPREGLRQVVGHALMALGRMIHGMEPERPGRSGRRAVDPC